MKTLIWPILSVIPPRACLVALNFSQPLLINRAVLLSVDNVTPWTTHVGYGLIGAYIIVYVGAAVSHPLHLAHFVKINVLPFLGCHGTIPTFSLSVYHYDPWRLDFNAHPQNDRPQCPRC